MKSIGEIKAILQAEPVESLRQLLPQLETDTRQGVQKLLAGAKKRIAAYEKEKARIAVMWQIENEYPAEALVGGTDEVGRGPLAGPVVAACVIMPRNCDLLYVNDSKQLSEAKREELYDAIMERAVSVGIGMVGHEKIDENNILQATYEAMRQAISGMTVKPEYLLTDAVTIPQLTMPQRPLIKGDARSYNIAAASIVAKVTRDRLMKEYDRLYPEYDFAANKGYGTAVHMEALRTYGPCPIHRRSFLPEGIFVNETK